MQRKPVNKFLLLQPSILYRQLSLCRGQEKKPEAEAHKGFPATEIRVLRLHLRLFLAFLLFSVSR